MNLSDLTPFRGWVIEGEVIKEFVDFTFKQPYTYKIKILDVHVNKEIYQPKQYRYLGGIIRYSDKTHNEYIKYFKAWNS